MFRTLPPQCPPPASDPHPYIKAALSHLNPEDILERAVYLKPQDDDLGIPHNIRRFFPNRQTHELRVAIDATDLKFRDEAMRKKMLSCMINAMEFYIAERTLQGLGPSTHTFDKYKAEYLKHKKIMEKELNSLQPKRAQATIPHAAEFRAMLTTWHEVVDNLTHPDRIEFERTFDVEPLPSPLAELFADEKQVRRLKLDALVKKLAGPTSLRNKRVRTMSRSARSPNSHSCWRAILRRRCATRR